MVNDHTGEALPLLGVGIVGWGWMGQVHARAYARLRRTAGRRADLAFQV